MGMNWALAATMKERTEEFSARIAAVDVRRGALRVDMLRSSYDEDRFDEMRENQELYSTYDDEHLKAVLGETVDSLVHRAPKVVPEWKKVFDDVMKQLHVRETTVDSLPVDQLEEVNKPTFPDVFIESFASWFKENMYKAISETIDQVDLDNSLSQKFVKKICTLDTKQAFEIVSRSLILELNVDRVEGRLEGNSPEQEFASFVETFRSKSNRIERYFDEYVVFGRRLSEYLIDSLNSRLDIVRAAVQDRNTIVEVFQWPKTSRFDDIEFGAGDTHNRGRSVCVLSTDSGSKIVWKPRSLAVDEKLNQFLLYLSEFGEENLPTPRTLNQKGYGWQEYVENRPCDSIDQFNRYYTRVGKWLCIAYLFGTTDLHYENIVAVGEYPVPIDLETLLHPRLGDSGDSTSISDEGRTEFASSVLSTGLLPSPFLPTELDEVGADLSGLSSVEGVETPFAVPVVENSGRSDMHVASRRVPLHPAGNIPIYQGLRANFRDYLDDVCAGFHSMYVHLIRYRDDIIESDIVRDGFSGLTVRVVPRATALYAQVLSSLTHPDYGRDALDGERLLSYFRMYPLSDATSEMAECEIEQLLRGDVPIFKMKSDDDFATDLTGAKVCMTDIGCPVSTFKEKLAKLSMPDLHRQLHYIELSFHASDLVGHNVSSTEESWQRVLGLGNIVLRPLEVFDGLRSPSEDDCRENATSIATFIGDHLISRSFKEKSQAWIGLKLISDRHWRLEPVGLDLYSGLSGIGLFFHELACITSTARFEQAACAIADAVAMHWIEVNDRGLHGSYTPLDNGMYGSIGGSLYYLGKVCQRRRDAQYLLNAVNALLSLSELSLDRCDSADIISGKAGLLQALAPLSMCEDEDVVRRAQKLTFRASCAIEEQAIRENGGLGWKSPSEGRSLLGYSHGASGVAVGLACGYSAFGSSFYQSPDIDYLIANAFGFEEKCYDVHNLWPDFRNGMASNSGAGTWCHGGAGIALARTVVDSIMGTSYCETHYYDSSMIKLHEEFSSNNSRKSNLSLCHGLLGNLEVLRHSRRTEDSMIVNSAELSVLDSIRRHGLPCGVPGGLEVPGLMTGLSGIGLGLLRFGGNLSVGLPFADV